MRPEETGCFPDITLKVKYYFCKCEKIVNPKDIFLHIHWNLVSILFFSLIKFCTNKGFLPSIYSFYSY